MLQAAHPCVVTMNMDADYLMVVSAVDTLQLDDRKSMAQLGRIWLLVLLTINM